MSEFLYDNPGAFFVGPSASACLLLDGRASGRAGFSLFEFEATQAAKKNSERKKKNLSGEKKDVGAEEGSTECFVKSLIEPADSRWLLAESQFVRRQVSPGLAMGIE